MIHNCSVNLARRISNELDFDKKRFKIIAYGLEIIIGGCLKLFAYILIPLILGIFQIFMFAYLSAAFLKLFSGGVHCSAYYRCFISTLLVFLTIGETARYLSGFELPYLEIFWLSLTITFFVFVKLSPVDVKEKPIKSEFRRKILKIVSLAMLLVYFLIFNVWNPGSDIILACSISILFHAFTLTRTGFAFFKFVDQII